MEEKKMNKRQRKKARKKSGIMTQQELFELFISSMEAIKEFVERQGNRISFSPWR